MPNYTLPGHNYIGPGNPLKAGKPVDADDAIAEVHDWRYALAKEPSEVRAADRDAIKEFSTDFVATGNFHSAIGAVGLGVKYAYESVFGVRYPAESQFSGEGSAEMKEGVLPRRVQRTLKRQGVRIDHILKRKRMGLLEAVPASDRSPLSALTTAFAEFPGPSNLRYIAETDITEFLTFGDDVDGEQPQEETGLDETEEDKEENVEKPTVHDAFSAVTLLRKFMVANNIEESNFSKIEQTISQLYEKQKYSHLTRQKKITDYFMFSEPK